MFIRKALTGGRGTGIFFTARLDYVEKLQNFDWVIVDVNIFDAIPGIRQGNQTRDLDKLTGIFYNLTRLTQEHYILGYPYPLVEAHNFVTLKSDFKEEVINRVKHSMYSTQHMDHVDIENMFLDIHSRF
jgi:NurA-like 5'-3' nuclease